MFEVRPLPIEQVSSHLAKLVHHNQWQVLKSEGATGYAYQARIAKNGVWLDYSSVKGEADWNIGLVERIHPPVSLEICRPPRPGAILESLGYEPTHGDSFFALIDSHLGEIEAYLRDSDAWEERVLAGARAYKEKYRAWVNGHKLSRDLAPTLAARNPWVTSSRSPTLAMLGIRSPARASHIGEFLRKNRVVLMGLAMGVAFVVARHA